MKIIKKYLGEIVRNEYYPTQISCFESFDFVIHSGISKSNCVVIAVHALNTGIKIFMPCHISCQVNYL